MLYFVLLGKDIFLYVAITKRKQIKLSFILFIIVSTFFKENSCIVIL